MGRNHPDGGQGCIRSGGAGGEGGLAGTHPPPRVPLWSPPKVGQTFEASILLALKAPKQNFVCQPQTLEWEGGWSREGVTPPLLLRCTAARIYHCRGLTTSEPRGRRHRGGPGPAPRGTAPAGTCSSSTARPPRRGAGTRSRPSRGTTGTSGPCSGRGAGAASPFCRAAPGRRC